MTEAKAIVTEKGLTTQDRLDKMIDAILTLRGLGLEPTGFTMDCELLQELTPSVMQEIVNASIENGTGIVDFIKEMQKWDYAIMGIPIEPDYRFKSIKIRKKE